MNIVHKYPSPLDCFFSVFFFKVYLLTSDLFVDSVNSSVAWLNVRCWGVAEERSVVDNGRPETGR